MKRKGATEIKLLSRHFFAGIQEKPVKPRFRVSDRRAEILNQELLSMKHAYRLTILDRNC